MIRIDANENLRRLVRELLDQRTRLCRWFEPGKLMQTAIEEPFAGNTALRGTL